MAMGGQNLDEGGLFYDGCHPNDDGYNRLAETVFQQITSPLKQIANENKSSSLYCCQSK